MNHGCVTLDEVFVAAGVRAASIVPETSGYLTLALGDATSRLPFAIDARAVTLSTEGTVAITRRGEMRTPEQAAAGLRAILARLLAVGTGTAMPSLAAAARARDESPRGVDAVVEEIEAALIPVNRAAARRALARLARETVKAKESGRLHRATLPGPVGPSRTAQNPIVPSAPASPPPAPSPAAASPAPSEAPAVATPPPLDDASPGEHDLAAPESSAAVHADSSPPEHDQAHLAAQATTPAPEPDPQPEPAAFSPPAAQTAEPTPTVLGMGAVDLAPSDALTTVDLQVDLPSPEPSGLSAVLAQPTEDPAVAFELDDAPRPLPPAALGEAREVAAAEPAAPIRAPEATTPAPAVVACAPPVQPEAKPTRADELLARFGASCADDDHMRETAACLRRLAGLDATPPPALAMLRMPLAAPPRTPSPAPAEASPVAPEAAPPATRKAVRAKRSSPSLALMLVVLVLGAAVGGALVRLRPDLFGALSGRLAPVVVHALEAPAPAPNASAAEPRSTAPSSLVDRLGGTRAERGSSQRAR